MINTSAVIFAGGRSSRMGTDKSLLPYAGYSSLASFQHHKLSKLFSKVYISSKGDKFDFDSAIIEDLYEESSPLVAIISTFETLDVDEVFVLSVDSPLVDEDSIKKLFLHNEETLDAIIAKSPTRIQPLFGIYKRSIVALAQKQLKAQNHRLTDLLKSSKTKFVLFENEQPFTNVNTPEEYQSLFIKSSL